jgi:predicted nucleotidyltransferase
MSDRIEIANKFIEEQRQKRDDIIGAFVVGSVARGEDTEKPSIRCVFGAFSLFRDLGKVRKPN